MQATPKGCGCGPAQATAPATPPDRQEVLALAVPDLVELMLDSKQREPARQWAIMTLINVHPVAHDVVVKGLIKASQDKGNYGVSSLARLQVRKIDRDAAEAAGVR